MESLQLHLLTEASWSVLLAVAAVVLTTPPVIRAARYIGCVSHPCENRWHRCPTALMGGIAMYGAATFGILAMLPLVDVWPILGGATLMFVVGAVDDLVQVRPSAKLAVQVVATGLLLHAGYAFGVHWPLWVSFPLTLLWVVGITNAVNLLDNMDGLAAGIAGISALIMVVFAGLLGSTTAVVVGGAVGGAALGFLWFNFEPARIFMGDCGSLFLGFSIAALALVIQQEAAGVGPVAVGLIPLAVLAVPILDTTLVTFMRKLAGRPVSQGGQDHTSHRLVFLGLSERHAVLMLYGIGLCSGALALTVLFVDVALFYALSIFVGIALGVFGLQVARANVYGGGEPQGDGAPTASVNPVRLLHNVFGSRWKTGGGMLVDVLLIGASFVVAHYLRYESGLTAVRKANMMNALPLVVGVKVMIFYAMGLYRGIWRHAGTPELVRTGGATLLASGATYGVYALLHGMATASGSVLVIDWMIVTLAIVGVRFGFRGLRQYFAANRKEGRRVLLYGAGDAGVLTLRELRRNPELRRQPIGFIDDDPTKQKQTIQGLMVHGTGGDLRHVCREHEVDEVIVTTAAIPKERRRDIYNFCQQEDIPCAAFDISVEPLRPAVAATMTDPAELVTQSPADS